MFLTSTFPGRGIRALAQPLRIFPVLLNMSAALAEDEDTDVLNGFARMPTIVSPARPPCSSTAGSPIDVQAALRAWADVIGTGHVKADPHNRDRYARTTGLHAHRPLAILYPESTAQVQEALRIAAAFRIGVHPISRGKNWGYGDAAATGENQIILDLQRMNRIIEVNAKLCYAVIEPGVARGKLHRYLQDPGTGLRMDSSGAGLEASIVGN